MLDRPVAQLVHQRRLFRRDVSNARVGARSTAAEPPSHLARAYNDPMTQSNNSTDAATGKQPRLTAVAIAAMGVVYGDIGTSPLYAMKEAFNGPHGVAVSQADS